MSRKDRLAFESKKKGREETGESMTSRESQHIYVGDAGDLILKKG